MARRCFTLAASLLFTLPYLGQADTFVLRDGGRIEGEWLNRDATPLVYYEIQLDSGGTLEIAADRVKQIIPISAEKKQYRHWLTKMPETADGHWRMAKWCAEKLLPNERLFHLQSTIALDPNHAQARAALGFRQVDGEWILTDDLMMARGFVKYKGRWRCQQDVELMEQAERDKKALADWTRKIRVWQRWLGTPQEGAAIDNLLGLTDPLVARVLIDLLGKEERPAVRRLYIRVLGQLATQDAIQALMQNSLNDPRKEVRSASLDELERLQPLQAPVFYLPALKSTDNIRVRRAAVALQRLGNESSIPPLIEALVTQHRVVISDQDPNRIDATFGNGGTASSGTGFSTGNRARVESRPFANREALDALLQLTNVNFQFDQAAWRRWLTERDFPDGTLNLRRDP